MKPRKIVQLTHAYYGRGETETYALADDGTLWVMSATRMSAAWEYSWKPVPWPPLPPIEEPEGDEGK